MHVHTLVSRAAQGLAALGLLCFTLWPVAGPICSVAFAQELSRQPIVQPREDQAGPQPLGRSEQAARRAAEDLAAEPVASDDKDTTAPPKEEATIDLLVLLFKGGYLMLPILAMSLLVVTFGIERFLGLRRKKVVPPELVTGLGQLAAAPGGLDPRRAYQLCRQYPSAAANVIRTMLLKVGRPHAELENAVTEANQREASRLYTNVRWLSLAAGVAPLLGLLGTVWGMIITFQVIQEQGVGVVSSLAGGISQALITTFA
ncbi:MAG: MotA/TolQ/ExbB proton channel family protein, partial [Pirellulales bacterium]|nr:MotA/TolQ/ExbB proton channel family protein [Pirellulales bacterium]